MTEYLKTRWLPGCSEKARSHPCGDVETAADFRRTLPVFKFKTNPIRGERPQQNIPEKAAATDARAAEREEPRADEHRFHGGDANQVHGLRCRRRGLPDTDSAGCQAWTDFDNEGRVIDTIQNYSASETRPAWNILYSTVYGDGDNLAYTYVTTTNATGGGTTSEYTAYVYGTMLGDTSPSITATTSLAQIAGIPDSPSDAVSDVSDFSSSDDTLAGLDATEDTVDRQAEVAPRPTPISRRTRSRIMDLARS